MIHLKLFEVISMRRSKQQWLELIQAQQASHLSIIDFCREQEFPLNNFYARRIDWLKSKRIETNVNSSAFSKVTVAETSKFPTIAFRQSNLIYSKSNRRRLASKINKATCMKMFIVSA
jgi:hypothetical protein